MSSNKGVSCEVSHNHLDGLHVVHQDLLVCWSTTAAGGDTHHSLQ